MIFKTARIALIVTVAGVLPGEGAWAATPDGDLASRRAAFPTLDHDVERNGGGDRVQLAQAGNRAPVVRRRIPDKTFKEGSQSTFSIPRGTFRDPDGDRLFIRVQENVDWMVSNGTTLTIRPAALDAPARVRVHARDRRGQNALSVVDEFMVTIDPLKGKGGESSNVPNDNGSVSDIIPAISADGRFIAQVFQTFTEDGGIVEGINVRDTARDDDLLWTLFRDDDSVEEAPNGEFVSSPAISADARIVAFAETAELDEVRVVRIVDTDPLEVERVRSFRAELGATRTTARQAVVSLSGNGRFVAFEDGAAIRLAKLDRGTPRFIDIGSNPSLSRTGRLIAYQRPGSDGSEVVLATLSRARTEVIDAIVIGPGSNATISDGSFVAFESGASDLVPCDTNGQTDIFIYNRLDDTVALASVDADGDQAKDDFRFLSNPSLSADGGLIAFDIFDEASAVEQVVVRELDTQGNPRGELRIVSLLAGDGPSAQPALSADGSFVAFTTDLIDQGFTVFAGPALSDDAPAVDFDLPPDPPGDISTQALLVAGFPIRCGIDPAFDADWYRVELVEGEAYRFELRADETSGTPLGDPFLELRDSEGTPVVDDEGEPVVDDDSGGGLNGFDAQLDFSASTSGTFFVVARGVEDAIGDYVLSVVTPPPAVAVAR
jgi:hypothetical protein